MASPFLCKPLKIHAVLRKMAGCTQSNLVQCDDGRLYVAKLYPSPHTANSLANEAIGISLQSHLDIPTPSWRTLSITRSDIARFPQLSFDVAGGRREPEPGIHFATQYLAEVDYTIADVVTWRTDMPVLNYLKFLDIYLFDIWAYHCDRRQWIYKVDRKIGLGRAIFIDNSHLFGGDSWGEALKESRHSSICTKPLTHSYDTQLRRSVKTFQRQIPVVLHRTIAQVPSEWYRGSATELEAWLLRRLDVFRDLVEMNLAFHGFDS